MPCTEFDRPDPLAGDRIMDATARLLAPRRLTLLPGILQGGARAPPKALCWTGRSAPPEERGPEGPSATPPPRRRAGSRRRAKHKKSSQGRGQDRRRSFQDPPRPTGHPKDSTEQESLMKPYYLDI